MIHRLTARTAAVAVLATLMWLPAGLGSSASAGCDAPTRAFLVGTHNVLHGKARFTAFAGIIGWQEVTDRRDRAKLKRQLGRGYRHYIPVTDEAAAVPISWRARNFRYITSRSVKVHRGREHVTPSRWINVVHLRQKLTGRRVVVINTHFISEAFKRGSSHRLWRVRKWHKHRTALYRVISQVRQRRPGTPIVVVGDVNRNGYFDFRHQALRPLRLGPGSHPVDHMYAGQPARGMCVERLSKAGSDHYRRRAEVLIR